MTTFRTARENTRPVRSDPRARCPRRAHSESRGRFPCGRTAFLRARRRDKSQRINASRIADPEAPRDTVLDAHLAAETCGGLSSLAPADGVRAERAGAGARSRRERG